MSIVVSDTSPLQYLLLLGEEDNLHKLFGKVYIPKAVYAEMRHKNSPAKLQKWARKLPDWVVVKTAVITDELSQYRIDIGELEAIALASKLKARLLLDDMAGKKVASIKKIPATGTLGVLVIMAKAGLIDLEKSLNKLQKTNFRCTKKLINSIIAENKKLLVKKGKKKVV